MSLRYTILTIFLLITLQGISQTNITWNASADVTGNSFGNQHPRIALDRSGDPMVIWGRLSDQSVFFSRWNGIAFTMPVKLNPTWMSVATADWQGPDIASYGDTVYVVVKRMPEAADTNRVFIFSSFDAGANFNTPVELALIADSVSRFPTVTTDATGNPIVGFMKFNSMFMDSRWAVTRSNDYGATFSTDVKASGWGGSAAVCDCCPGAVVSHGDTTLMLYRNNDNNVRDMWAGLSSDNATTFNTGMAVDNNNWMIMMCPSSGPDGLVVNDTLYSVFMNGGSGSTLTYLSKTDLSSGTLSSVSQLTNPPGLTLQNFPRIAGDGNAVGIVWRQIVNGITQLPIRFTNNIAAGLPAVYDTVDLNNVTNTDIGIANGKVVVVWQDDNTGTVKYRSGTYIPVGTGITEIENTNILIYPNPVSNLFSIQLPGNMEMEWLTVYDSRGRICIDRIASGNKEVLDGAVLKSGVYTVRIISDVGVFTEKLIR